MATADTASGSRSGGTPLTRGDQGAAPALVPGDEKRGRSVAISPRKQLLEACEEILGYQFGNPDVLLAALTHASGADSRTGSNERLEFLGDSVLSLVICDYLFERYPELLEGELTKIKSVVVSRRTCAKISRAMRLDRFLVLGRGMAAQASLPVSVLAAVFESLIAAIYKDGGFEAARTFIVDKMKAELDKAASGHHGGNYKSVLQQLSQKEFGAIPLYEVLSERGPDHSKSFRVSAVIGDRHFAPAWGRNKKEAQQRAAMNALGEIHGEEIPYPSP